MIRKVTRIASVVVAVLMLIKLIALTCSGAQISAMWTSHILMLFLVFCQVSEIQFKLKEAHYIRLELKEKEEKEDAEA